ncbi:hypothetical protein BKA70DRAFT_1442727 [Coprinopsis sp. MPI-PUGE-AT-0042]|nr:hypothetical protein BKA70DRAFT_1442727 [Coprinopsis sp. MPI-PUGE-AT-0042]
MGRLKDRLQEQTKAQRLHQRNASAAGSSQPVDQPSSGHATQPLAGPQPYNSSSQPYISNITQIPGVGVLLQHQATQPPYPSAAAIYHPGAPPYTFQPTPIPYTLLSYAVPPGLLGTNAPTFPGAFASPPYGAQPFLGFPGSPGHQGPTYTSMQTHAMPHQAVFPHYTQPMQPTQAPTQPMQAPTQPMQAPVQPAQSHAPAPSSDSGDDLRACQEAEQRQKDLCEWQVNTNQSVGLTFC